jgi:hypothetical protein
VVFGCGLGIFVVCWGFGKKGVDDLIGEF